MPSKGNNANQSRPNFTSAGKAPAISRIQAVALYDSQGRIHHMHHVVVMEGAETPAQGTSEGEAVAHAKRLGLAVDELKTLFVPDFANSGARHRVDVDKLVRVESPAAENKPRPR